MKFAFQILRIPVHFRRNYFAPPFIRGGEAKEILCFTLFFYADAQVKSLFSYNLYPRSALSTDLQQ